MNSIRFNRRYQKLGVLGNRMNMPYTATLVSVQKIDLQNLPAEFLKYDTDDGRYVLPKSGEYILLLFLSVGGLFTTLRSNIPQSKAKEYESKIGEEFEIIFDKCEHKNREYTSFIDSPLGGSQSYDCKDCGESFTVTA